MERELLEKILALLESMKGKIEALEAKSAEAEGRIEGVSNALDSLCNEADFLDFSDAYGGKFDAILGDLRKTIGDEYNPVRVAFDEVKGLRGTEGFDEGSYVDTMLEQIVQKLNSLKAAIPEEAKPAVEAAINAVENAAEVKEVSGEPKDPGEPAGDPEGAEDGLDDDLGDEWAKADLEAEYKKDGGRRAFA